jgi:hypothetical protein
MPDVTLLPILAATIMAFVLGATYYALLGRQLAEVSEAAAAAEQPPPWKIAVELLRWGLRSGSGFRSCSGRAC